MLILQSIFIEYVLPFLNHLTIFGSAIKKISGFFLILIILAIGCRTETDIPPLFQKLSPEQTGIEFSNTITSGREMNIQNHPFIYNGGGVAVGDVSGNGLPDIYLTGNQVSRISI